MQNPTTAKEYWELVTTISEKNGLIYNEVWTELSNQITPIIDREEDTEKVIQEITKLPFPEFLGLCDSREYDTFCAGVIGGLQKVIRDAGKTPAPLPANAPTMSRQVVAGNISYYDNTGTSRASAAHAKQAQEEMEKEEQELEKLDSTDACKEALADHYSSNPIAKDAKAWKRKKKLKEGEIITRVFECPAAKLLASVIFDRDSEEPLTVVEEEVKSRVKGTFPKSYGKDRTGSAYFSMNNVESDYIDFYCGPQTRAGHLDDINDPGVDATMEELFKGYDFELAAAENFHIIKPKAGQTIAELKEEVINKITGAGAIDFSEPSEDLDM